MEISILNNFRGDKEKHIDTATKAGKAEASKLLSELLKSGSAVFLEREVDGETKTYRVTGYDAKTDKLVIRNDEPRKEVDTKPRNKGRTGPRGHYRSRHSTVSSSTGRVVSVAPVSGGV